MLQLILSCHFLFLLKYLETDDTNRKKLLNTLQLDPCADVDCGKYRVCKVTWGKKQEYQCVCPKNSYGERCQKFGYDRMLTGLN